MAQLKTYSSQLFPSHLILGDFELNANSKWCAYCSIDIFALGCWYLKGVLIFLHFNLSFDDISVIAFG